ncbi:uncharacterized protein LOC124911715 [Impatiens glandulifera]|uniref:uncharacterized protein LOC124911715 n=1 Tax=Impatiens glandulifera TaxID=253017 RepID=UPI001FB10034|nr:uncharacterized protein LOC124911715 [Impatiens glandulifera]
MQRIVPKLSTTKSCIKILRNYSSIEPYRPIIDPKPCDVFINHRGVDTKGNVSGLLYDRLSKMGINTFLDKKSMGPGDKLSDEIETGIRNCRVAIAVFSPRYGESYYCLHELALIMECKKRLVPIFWNVQPSGLKIKNTKKYSKCEINRFNWALEEARQTIGIRFDSTKGSIEPYRPIIDPKPYDVFINHRGVDTKGNVSGLLYDRLSKMGIHTFLDKKSMGPGDKLSEEIETGIRNCQVAIAVFSPRYRESYYCLHELALIMECKKRLVPIFWNVQPSGLKIKNTKKYSKCEINRFNWALEEARQTIGIRFDSTKG